MPHRVRVERGDDHRPPFMRPTLHRPPDHRLMARVEAVEIAQRDDRATQRIRDRLVMEQALHLGQGLAGLNCKSRRLTQPSAIPIWLLSRFTGHRRRILARAVFPLEGVNALRWGGRVPAALWS